MDQRTREAGLKGYRAYLLPHLGKRHSQQVRMAAIKLATNSPRVNGGRPLKEYMSPIISASVGSLLYSAPAEEFEAMQSALDSCLWPRRQDQECGKYISPITAFSP